MPPMVVLQLEPFPGLLGQLRSTVSWMFDVGVGGRFATSGQRLGFTSLARRPARKVNPPTGESRGRRQAGEAGAAF